MSQRNISHLPSPVTPCRVDRFTPRQDRQITFETTTFARQVDVNRANGLRNCVLRYPGTIDVEHALRLADQLEQSGETGANPVSLASSLYMRKQRLKVIGALWQLMGVMSSATTFTIIPRGWTFTPDQLASVDPTSLLAAFRTDLYRKWAANAGGWLFVFIHGEFDPVAGVFRLHIHGACSLEMVPVLERLKLLPKYKSSRTLPDGSWDPVYRRVWIRRKALNNMPDPITYLMQAFWPSRPIYVDTAGKRRRVREKRAIRYPYHAMMLLWLDRWRLQDLTLLVGLRVTRNGLIKTQGRR